MWTLSCTPGSSWELSGRMALGRPRHCALSPGWWCPTSGHVTFAEEEVSGYSSFQLVARGLAMVPEGRQIFADQTVNDNLILGAYLRIGKDNVGVAKDIRWVLELFRLCAKG